jgi:hypothetical protein
MCAVAEDANQYIAPLPTHTANERADAYYEDPQKRFVDRSEDSFLAFPLTRKSDEEYDIIKITLASEL